MVSGEWNWNGGWGFQKAVWPGWGIWVYSVGLGEYLTFRTGENKVIELCLEKEPATGYRADRKKELKKATSTSVSTVNGPLNLLNWHTFWLPMKGPNCRKAIKQSYTAYVNMHLYLRRYRHREPTKASSSMAISGRKWEWPGKDILRQDY